MNGNINTDFPEMEKKLKFYINKGRVTGSYSERRASDIGQTRCVLDKTFEKSE